MSASALHRQAALALSFASHECVYTVREHCMAPRIPEGTCVRVQRCQPEALVRGDVVLLCADGTHTFLHRYLGTCVSGGEVHLLCKGDARRRPDAPWPVHALVGRAEGIAEGEGSRPFEGEPGALRLWLWLVAAKLAVALGVIQTQRPPAVRRISAGAEVWEILTPLSWSLLQPFFAASTDHGKAVNSLGRSPKSLRIHIEPGMRQARLGTCREEDAVVLSAEGIEVRVDDSGKGGEVRVREALLLQPALDTFFRASAMHLALAEEGVCLHAASVLDKATGGVYLFSGPSGSGKTTAAEAFSEGEILDDDFVLLLPEGEGYRRAPWSPMAEGEGRDLPGDATVRAILFPAKSETFALAAVQGADAVRGCLHRFPVTVDVERMTRQLDSAARLAERVPMFHVAWKKGTDLALLLRAGLGQES